MDALLSIFEYEQTHDPEEFSLGWSWSDVRVVPATLNSLLLKGLFGDIIGHDDVKELLTAALIAEKPVHVLLAGPLALAKSLFLWDIERVCGE